MNADGTKRCHRCGENKGPTAFWRDAHLADGLASSCRACLNAGKRARKRAAKLRPPPPRPLVGRFAPVYPRDGWCPNCAKGLHGPDCAAAYFGPDCTCRCGVLGYRAELGLRDLTAPAPMDREIA